MSDVVDPDRRGRWTADRVALAILAGLVVAGLALRVLATISWWPISASLADSWPYAYYAGTDPFNDPQHPAGYSLLLAFVGVFTREVAVVGILQHLLGIASALILFAGIRRLCGSPWPGLAGAAVVLLGADQVYLERTIMSETLFTFLLAATVYATARALDEPERSWPWPVAAAALAVSAGIVRPAGIVLLPLIALVLLLVRPGAWRERWRPAAAFSGLALAGLFAFASANHISHDRFEIGPTPGWHLYSRAATIADCSQFDPPQGTDALCEETGREERLGMDWYLYDVQSPATRLFGGIGINHGAGDAELGAWARQAILHDPRAYLEAVWPDLRAYFLPDDYEFVPGRGTDLDGQLDWSTKWPPGPEAETERGMEEFFDPFEVERNRGELGFLHDYQRVFRFGGTLLTIAALLTLVGLCIGPRRNRIAVLLLGVGGLAMFLVPTFSVVYSGRYTVPSAGLLAAAAVVVVMPVWRRVRPGAEA